MKRYVLIFILLVWYGAVFAEIALEVAPTKATLGDTIKLTLTVNDVSITGTAPDLSPLQKYFHIVGTQQSMSYSVSNGQAHAISQWIILLTPKQTGIVPIPAIKIGQQYSQSSQVDIKDTQEANTVTDSTAHASHEALFLKTEVSNTHPFLNEQVIYTVKLYHSQRLVDADYQPPSIEDALLFPLGDGQSYQSVLDGQTYAVEEQQYAVFPQKSGTLRLVAPIFQALVYDQGPARVRALAKTTALSVKPVPATFTGKHWFPAKQVKLTEVYSNQETVITKGNTLVRTVTLQAVGVPAQLLPQLVFDGSEQLRVYPEKPDIDNVIRQKELISKTVVKVTYLFQKSGQVSIPALRLKWFNTVTGKEEEAILPARALEIKAKIKATPMHYKAAATKPMQAEKLQPKRVAQVAPLPSTPNVAWIVVGVLAIGWIMTLVVWWLSHRSLSVRRSKRVASKRLHDACMRNQVLAARTALLHWAALQWPDVKILNMTDLTRVVHDAVLKKQLTLLSQALYSQDGKITWRGDALWHSVVAHRAKRVTKKNKKETLPPINPF